MSTKHRLEDCEYPSRQFVNCTPHPLVIRRAGKDDLVLPPSGLVPRVSTSPGSRQSYASDMSGVEIYAPDKVGDVTGLPDEAPGVYLIVSGMVGAAMKGKRGDLLVPGTGPADGAIREGGRIVAVTRLKRV